MSEMIELIKELRERTGAGLMDCKKALLENNNDVTKAATWLREKGIAKQAKKAATRIAAEGVATVVVDGNKAVVVELNCETDFVAKSDPFKDLVQKCAKAVLENEPADIEAAKALVKEDFVDAGVKLGEKLDFRRFVLVHKNDDEVFGPYVHMKGAIATLVVLKGGNPEVANGVALNVCSDNPSYAVESDIPADVIAAEKAVQTEAAKQDPSFSKKPAQIQEKIILGRVNKVLFENVLVDKLYVLDQEKTVGQVLKENNATVVSYVRYAVGEGIEKRKDDFAAEVAAQAAGK